MKTVGIRALKQNASSVVAEAASGVTITITDRGRPVAQLSPTPSSPLAAILVAGRGRLARGSLSDLRPPLPGPSVTEELSAMRDAERE